MSSLHTRLLSNVLWLVELDANVGEAPVAFVELKQGVEAMAEEIIEHTNSQIAAFKKIKEVKFLNAIPVSPAGKVLKRELREMLQKYF